MLHAESNQNKVIENKSHEKKTQNQKNLLHCFNSGKKQKCVNFKMDSF